jgi:hypothetical protein
MRRSVLAAAMVLTAGSCGLLAGGDGTFGADSQLRTDLFAGGGKALVAGDFNHDGKPDLATADVLGEVQVLLQDPLDRTVWKKLPGSPASGIHFLRTADFDGDANDDLMGVNPGKGAYFLRSMGGGNFAPPAAVKGAVGPRWLTLGDFDGDGDIDLATADPFNEANVSVFRAGGDGTFSLVQKLPIWVDSVEALDYDGDGKLDLAAGGGPGLDLLKGSGGGGFMVQRAPPIPGFCYLSLAISDFNNDGLDDVASGCAVGISRGDGTFRNETLAGGHFPVAVADLNGDGTEDLAFLMPWGVVIHTGSGDGRFRPPLIVGPSGSSTTSYAAALLARDLDGDNLADLVAPGIVSSSLGVRWGKPGGFLQSSSFGITGFGPVKTMAVSDVGADGSRLLLLPKVDQSRIDAYLLRPGRADPVLAAFSIESHSVYTSIESADLDGDGWLDLAGASSSGGFALMTLLDSAWKVRSRTSMPAGRFPAAVVPGLLDGDEVMDLVVPCSGSSHLAVFQGLGWGSFAPAKTFPSITSPKDLALADLDGDGVLDAAVISNPEVGVHFGAGDADLGEAVSVDRNDTRQYLEVATADVSADGLPDLLTLEKTRGLLVFQAAAGRAFQPRDPVAVSAGEAISLASADLDGDGLTDVTVTSVKPAPNGTAPEPSLAVLLNRPGGFGPRTTYPLPFVPLGHKLADLDRDGALDVVAYDPNIVLIFFGNSVPPPSERFRRGDADGDGAMELSDAIAVLDRLFLGGEPLGCPDAADANDDGELDLTDPIAILSRLFLGGDALPPPGSADCGVDPTPDGLPVCRRDC